LLRNAQNRWVKGKDERGEKKSQLFRPKVFDMCFPQKVFYGVFELPLLRNAQKRHKKISKIKKKKYLPTPFIICQVYVAFNFIFLRRPSQRLFVSLTPLNCMEPQGGGKGVVLWPCCLPPPHGTILRPNEGLTGSQPQ
jgi:hypothetical protein